MSSDGMTAPKWAAAGLDTKITAIAIIKQTKNLRVFIASCLLFWELG